MFSSFLSFIHQEKKKIEGMRRADAARYLFDYYKLPAIALLCALLLIVYFTAVLLRPKVEPDLQVLFVNCYDSVSANSDFAQSFEDHLAQSGTPLQFQFDANVFFNLEKSSDYASAYFQKTIAQLEGGTADAIVCSRENLLGIASGGRVMDLSQAYFERYADRLILLTTQEGETVPVGIDLTGCAVFEQLGFYPEGACLGISAYTEKIESVLVFLDFLFQMEK